MNIIDGKAIAKEIKEKVKCEVEQMLTKPTLACIIVEGNKASEVYVASKEKACIQCGIGSKIVRLPNDITQEELHNTINQLNNDPSISAILLQLPLPNHLDDKLATNQILPSKDVDCLTYHNLGMLFSATPIIAPCTATGIMRILEHEHIEVSGKRVVVIGRSLLVGKSVANLLEQANATVTICHSRTKNMQEICRQADILVVAIGKEKYIDHTYIKDGAVVIDVGINRTENGLVGDVDFDDTKDFTSFITPVPGGVGPLTVACLMENTVTLFKNSIK